MIKHVTLINFKEGTSNSHKTAVKEAFDKLPEHIPEIRDFSCGVDQNLLEGNAGFAVFASFDNKDDFLVYANHSAHGEVIFPVCGEVMESYSTAQISDD